MSDFWAIVLLFAVILFVLLCVVYGLRWAWLKWRPADRANRRFLVRILVLYLVVLLAERFTESFFFDRSELMSTIGRVLRAPLDFVEAVVPVLFAAWLIWNVRPNSNTTSPPGAEARARLRKLVENVFRSEEFLTALSTSLPKGEADEKNGLDYIPYMLTSVDQRRRSFERSARVFFWSTIVIGALFAGIVATFGYLLVNEEAAGTPRLIRELSNHTASLNEKLKAIGPDEDRKVFESIRSNGADRLARLDVDKQFQESRDGVVRSIRSAPDARELSQFLQDAETKAPSTERHYVQVLTDILESVQQHAESVAFLRSQLPMTIRTQEESVRTLKESAAKQENEIPEIIRRVSVGAIVTTFFFAILRYLAGLYRKDYEEVRRAYAEDLALRRFVVAYKSAGTQEKDRSLAISSLVSQSANAEADSGSGLDITEAESNVLKELLSALLKKLG